MAVRRVARDDPASYLTVSEAAARLEVSISTIWRWIARGDLRAYRVGRRSVRLKRDDVQGMVRRLDRPMATSTTVGPPAVPYITLADPDDIWAGYDAAAVRQALREVQRTPILTPEEADALFADLYRARVTGSRPPTRP